MKDSQITIARVVEATNVRHELVKTESLSRTRGQAMHGANVTRKYGKTVRRSEQVLTQHCHFVECDVSTKIGKLQKTR